MNDASTPWVDPELIAAGKLLQEKGFVVPDRTVAPLSEVRAAQELFDATGGAKRFEHDQLLVLPGFSVPTSTIFEGV